MASDPIAPRGQPDRPLRRGNLRILDRILADDDRTARAVAL
jgi:hypothetical protein